MLQCSLIWQGEECIIREGSTLGLGPLADASESCTINADAGQCNHLAVQATRPTLISINQMAGRDMSGLDGC